MWHWYVYLGWFCVRAKGRITFDTHFHFSNRSTQGLDHSVANMFIIPLGILRGADITIAQFLTKNLIPVTLGNIVGGALCVMAPFGTQLGKWFKSKDE